MYTSRMNNAQKICCEILDRCGKVFPCRAHVSLHELNEIAKLAVTDVADIEIFVLDVVSFLTDTKLVERLSLYSGPLKKVSLDKDLYFRLLPRGLALVNSEVALGSEVVPYRDFLERVQNLGAEKVGRAFEMSLVRLQQGWDGKES